MNKYSLISVLFIPLIILFVAWPTTLYAQDNDRYYMANRLLQQREYEQAYEIFAGLHRKNPRVYIYFNKMTECLINLKKYEKAAELSREAAKQGFYRPEAKIRLGEIYYIQRDSSKAKEVWDEILNEYPDNLQVHLSMARAMSDRRAYDQAIEVYKRAAKMFNDQRMFSNEIAHTYLLAGRYEKSIRQYLKLIQDNPERSGFVQSMLLRFDDEYLYDIAILELDDFLDKLDAKHPAYHNLHQLQLWLLMEQELYERALAEAKRYEDSHSRVSYTLYSLGAQLAAGGKFKLAEQAFLYYIENDIRQAKYQSLQELGSLYIEWADYLSDYNLSTYEQRTRLYQKALGSLRNIVDNAPNYHGINEVYFTLSELAMDFLHDLSVAKKYYDRLDESTDSTYLARKKYMEGRIELYNGEYARARIAFSNANRKEGIGNLAEKTRYYLALADFYAGDYGYAKIQLNALERQNTSYYANDAVRLRTWIQEGLQADSTGRIIDPFAKAMEWLTKGRTDSAMTQLDSVFDYPAYHPLADEALLELGAHVTPAIAHDLYRLIEGYIESNGRFSPLRERLMWEKARLADQQFFSGKNGYHAATRMDEAHPVILSREELIAIYEQIVMEYPDGFYASFARERIAELQNTQT